MKKQYATPKLSNLGDIKEITFGGGPRRRTRWKNYRLCGRRYPSINCAS